LQWLQGVQEEVEEDQEEGATEVWEEVEKEEEEVLALRGEEVAAEGA
jgi:hypothetical protein